MNGETWSLVDASEGQKGAMLAWMQEIAPYGIFTTDTDLTIRSWNQWLVTHSGQRAETVIGRSLMDVFPEIVARRLDDHFRRAVNGEISVLSTALHKYLIALPAAARGFNVPQMLQTVRVAPLALGEHVVGTITTIEDVTQRECQAVILHRQQEHDRLLSSALALLLESEDPLRVAAELFPRIAAPLKLEAYFNFLLTPGSTKMRLHAAGGIPPEVRKSLATLPVGEGACGFAAESRRPVIVSRVQSNTEPHNELIRRLGLRSYAGFPLLLGDRLLGTLSFGSYDRDVIANDEIEFLTTIAQYLAIAIDRALREDTLRQAQKSLSEHAEELEDKIAERTAKLHETIQQLESFSYTIAHDLRAPIRSLKGYTEILLSDYGAAVPTDAHSILHRLQRASNRLDALTRDLLKFSKIARQDVQLGPVDVTDLVQDIVAATPPLHDVVTIHAPLGVAIAQRTLLQQCFSNLFDNALKFARSGEKPRITVRAESTTTASAPPMPPAPAHAFNPSTAARDHHGPGTHNGDGFASRARLRIWIEDNGIGIDPQAHEKIFGIFERVSGLDHVEGTGIGLAIVARAMQQMGGSCGVESKLGQGSRFWLDLTTAG